MEQLSCVRHCAWYWKMGERRVINLRKGTAWIQITVMLCRTCRLQERGAGCLGSPRTGAVTSTHCLVVDVVGLGGEGLGHCPRVGSGLLCRSCRGARGDGRGEDRRWAEVCR